MSTARRTSRPARSGRRTASAAARFCGTSGRARWASVMAASASGESSSDSSRSAIDRASGRAITAAPASQRRLARAA